MRVPLGIDGGQVWLCLLAVGAGVGVGAARGTSIAEPRLTGHAAIPVIVRAVAVLTTLDPAARLGVDRVRPVPCTDWFAVCGHLGRPDASLATARTPTILLATSCC